MRRYCRRLGLNGFTGIDSNGMSGGLALYWDDSLFVEVQDICERYIDVHVRVSSEDPLWRMTCVYGEPRTDLRHYMWNKLQELKQKSDLPWIVVGDFNEALWQFEHFSATARPEYQMAAFREVLAVCELTDIGFSGLPYTFDNKQSGQRNVKVCLDRAVTDDRWRTIFTEAQLVHLVSPCSDHCPLLVRLAQEEQVRPRHKCLQYEIYWERDATLPERIAWTWNETERKGTFGGHLCITVQCYGSIAVLGQEEIW